MKASLVVPLIALVILQMITTPVGNGRTATPQSIAANVEAFTPPPGSAERKAILDAFRAVWTKNGPIKDVVFIVKRLKVHGAWAWLDVRPGSADGSQNYEDEQGLLRKEEGEWKVLERTAGTSAGYFKKLRAKYPAAPADIFPQA